MVSTKSKSSHLCSVEPHKLKEELLENQLQVQGESGALIDEPMAAAVELVPLMNHADTWCVI